MTAFHIIEFQFGGKEAASLDRRNIIYVVISAAFGFTELEGQFTRRRVCRHGRRTLEYSRKIKRNGSRCGRALCRRFDVHRAEADKISAEIRINIVRSDRYGIIRTADYDLAVCADRALPAFAEALERELGALRREARRRFYGDFGAFDRAQSTLFKIERDCAYGIVGAYAHKSDIVLNVIGYARNFSYRHPFGAVVRLYRDRAATARHFEIHARRTVNRFRKPFQIARSLGTVVDVVDVLEAIDAQILPLQLECKVTAGIVLRIPEAQAYALVALGNHDAEVIAGLIVRSCGF